VPLNPHGWSPRSRVGKIIMFSAFGVPFISACIYQLVSD
jgi:hypothetical protein